MRGRTDAPKIVGPNMAGKIETGPVMTDLVRLGNLNKRVRTDAFRDTYSGGDERSGEPRRRWLAKLPRRPFYPQKEALSLIS